MIKNAFEVSGPLIERITAVCQGPNEANKWVELLSMDAQKTKSNDAPRNMSSSAVGIQPNTSQVSAWSTSLVLKLPCQSKNPGKAQKMFNM